MWKLGVSFVSCLLAVTAAAESRFTTATVSVGSQDGAPDAITFEILEQPVPDANDRIRIDGKAFSPAERAPVPITIETTLPSDPDVVASSFELSNTDNQKARFSRFDYDVKIEGGPLSRVILLGTSADGTPASVSIADDPGPWVWIAIYVGAQVAFCAEQRIASWIKECPKGSNTTVKGTLAGISCSFECK